MLDLADNRQMPKARPIATNRNVGVVNHHKSLPRPLK
jgi:hypothetical protein